MSNLFELLKSNNIDSVIDNSGNKVSLEDLKSKDIIGVYFSAHWCPPCRQFTPVLNEIYKKNIADYKSFELIFVSSDQNEKSFQEYFGTMAFKALDYSERSTKEVLAKAFDVRGIPMLVLFNGKGELLSKDGRSLVQTNQFPFVN